MSRRSPRTTTSTSSAVATRLLRINGNPVAPVTAAPISAPGGCAHDLCELGDKLDASCNWLRARQVCDKDDPTAATAATSRITRSSRLGREVRRRGERVLRRRRLLDAARSRVPAAKSAEAGRGAAAGGRALPDPAAPTYSDATDKTIRLLWSSDRLAKQVDSAGLAVPAGSAAGRRGLRAERHLLRDDHRRQRRAPGSRRSRRVRLREPTSR